jgi:hypothetical protein
MKTRLLFIALFAAVAGTAQNVAKSYDDNAYDAAYDHFSEPDHIDLITLDIPAYGIAGSYSISGQFNNQLTGAVSSATINYSIDNGPATLQKIDPQAISRGPVTDFKFASDVNLAPGNHIVKVWLSEINGVAQTTPQLISTEVHIASRAAKRHGLIELFTSSTCPPCAEENKTYDPLLVKNTPNIGADLNVIKYQMNWPSPGNDPSYNAHGNSRRGYYSINGIPDGRVNGQKKTFNTQAGLDASKTTPATVDITATLLVSGTDIKAKATITPYVTSTVTVHQALLQDYYTYNGSAGQTKYYFAMRKMNPDGGGAKNTSIKDGTPFDVTFNHTATQATKPAQGSFDFWTINTLKYQYVVFVQDDNTKDVLNSASALQTTVGIVDLKENAQIGIYPNPAEAYAIVGIKLQNQSNVSLQIYDISGKVVYSNQAENVGIGQNEITINTSHFAAGVYTVVVKTNNSILRDKLVVN